MGRDYPPHPAPPHPSRRRPRRLVGDVAEQCLSSSEKSVRLSHQSSAGAPAPQNSLRVSRQPPKRLECRPALRGDGFSFGFQDLNAPHPNSCTRSPAAVFRVQHLDRPRDPGRITSTSAADSRAMARNGSGDHRLVGSRPRVERLSFASPFETEPRRLFIHYHHARACPGRPRGSAYASRCLKRPAAEGVDPTERDSRRANPATASLCA